MKLYSENKEYKLYQGNMLDMLEVIEPNSIDSIVTDPPYELNFMNKGWDNSGIAFRKETWEKCLAVLKPGGYLLAFGGSRTFHRIACAIEDAGFEIRDTICWLYGSGFPKSMNIGLAIDKKNGVKSEIGGIKQGHEDFVGRKTNGHMQFDGGMSGFDRPWMHDEEKREAYHYNKLPTSESAKQWQGWGTSLKPSFEPIIVARKPCEGSCIDNVLKYGVGGINIDECRIPLSSNEPDNRVRTDSVMHTDGEKMWYGENGYAGKDVKVYKDNGRFPANTILTYDENTKEEVCSGCSGFPYTISSGGSGEKSVASGLNGKVYMGGWSHDKAGEHLGGLGDSGSASRYFYCAKASKKDRDEGLDEFEEKRKAGCGYDLGYLNAGEGMFKERQTLKKNTRPTVKPTDLMQYLVRLVTPTGGTVLDPFNGSGSTGKAVIYENVERGKNYKYIGIELTEEYLPISKARIEYAQSGKLADMFSETSDSEEKVVEHKPITKVVQLW